MTTLNKALVPLVLGIIAVVTQWQVTGAWTTSETLTVLAALTTAIGVWLVPNAPPGPPGSYHARS